jgi:hypothetical protein
VVQHSPKPPERVLMNLGDMPGALVRLVSGGGSGEAAGVALTFAFGQEHHGFVARPRVLAGSALGAVAIAAIGSAPAAPRALHGQLLISEWSYEGSCGTEYGRD